MCVNRQWGYGVIFVIIDCKYIIFSEYMQIFNTLNAIKSCCWGYTQLPPQRTTPPGNPSSTPSHPCGIICVFVNKNGCFPYLPNRGFQTEKGYLRSGFCPSSPPFCPTPVAVEAESRRGTGLTLCRLSPIGAAVRASTQCERIATAVHRKPKKLHLLATSAQPFGLQCVA